MAGVAHEINTPIGIGVTAASYLSERSRSLAQRFEAGSLTREELAKFIAQSNDSAAMVLSNLQRAAELIRSFKQVAVDQTGGQRRSFYMKEYLEEVIRSLSPQLGRTSHVVDLMCPVELEVMTSPGDISQIITNLVMNSLIHGFDGVACGHIGIEVSVEGEEIILRYRDDGRGIAPEHLPHIFEPFFTTRRGQGGSGLGLHVVYNIVTQGLAGRISCASKPGQGVLFEIRLPGQSPQLQVESGMAPI